MTANQAQITAATADAVSFEDDLRATVAAVREAVIDLMNLAGANPNRSSDVARQLGLRPGLTWKICKVAQETDVVAAVPHMPGPAGLELIFDAFERSGVPGAAVGTARAAGRAFNRMVETHTGDRQTLMTMLGQMSPDQTNGQLEADRKLGFIGNSSTWGVQARLILSTQIVAPNPDEPSMVDVAGIFGHYDVRRLRRSAGWVLLKSLSYNDDGSLRKDARTPLDPGVEPGDGLPLIREFCDGLPDIREVGKHTGPRFELTEGPVGQTGAFTCVFGSFDRKFASAFRDERNLFGEHPILVYMPAETLIADLFVHRDLAFAPPEAQLYSCLFSGMDGAWPRPEQDRMAMSEPILDLGRPPNVATPDVPRYPKLLELACERLGSAPREFHGYRLVMSYPPIPTALVLRYELADPRHSTST